MEPWPNNKDFDTAPEQEQIQRLHALQSLFADKRGLENPEALARANFYDFIEHSERYASRFGISGRSKEEVGDLLYLAKCGNRLIKQAIELYSRLQESEAGAESDLLPNAQLELEMSVQDDDLWQFIDRERHCLNVERLLSLFRWSLDSFIRGGEKIGRSPSINPAEIDPLVNDLAAILRQVNKTEFSQ